MKTIFNFANPIGGGIISCVEKFNSRRWIPLLVLMLFSIIQVFGQISLCNYDRASEVLNSTNSGMLQQMQSDEETMQEAMQSNPQAIMNNVTYTIPIVFHILHLGEAEGSGSNISRNQVLQALADLNSDFANTGIQWCLAQQDPDGNSQYDIFGNNITGIQRVNAIGIPDFFTYGIWSGVNEVQSKALSNWPEANYTEVWVAHRLYTGSGDAAGFAYFPAAGDDIDGIALRADATGTASNSKVFAHEAGHYLTLYHTFHQATNTTCPPNADCQTEGDMICDTRAHNSFSSFPFPCDESQYTSCDPSFSQTYQVTQNHMNYTDNSCRVEFTPKQDMRMRCALMSLRGSLLGSVGCIESCPNVVSNFTFPSTIVGIGSTVTFTNISTGALNYEWLLNGDLLATTTNWSHLFLMGGTYEVCLDAYGIDDCVRRNCKTINVTPSCIPNNDPCEKVQNGYFEQISPGLDVNNFMNVCGWEKIQSSPFFCDGPSNNAIGLYFYSTFDNERITSSEPLELEVGVRCRISFDYLVTINSPNKIIVALASNNLPVGNTGTPLEASATVIAEVLNPSSAYSNQSNNRCYNENYGFQTFEATFTVINPSNRYLTITGVGGQAGATIVFIDNVSINCCGLGSCDAEPDFTFDPDCPKEFFGTNTGDGDQYTWNFLCNGVSMSGQNIIVDLPVGDCEVCLTVKCDEETGRTICQTVTTPEKSETCFPACAPLTIPLQTCEQDINTENTFVATFILSVPDGTGPCLGGSVLSSSQAMDIDLTSYSNADDPNDPSKDIITIGLEVTTPPGFDLLNTPVAGTINLCDADGNIICYTITFTGTECDNCGGEINVTAICNDPNPYDNVFIYSGTTTINLPSGGFFICDPISSQGGYSQSVSIAGGQATVNFSIVSGVAGDFNAQTILCFESLDFGQICYTLDIDIIPCTGTECVQKWNPKTINCTKGSNGTLTYNFSMSQGMIGSAGYVMCPGGLQAELSDEGGDPIVGGSIQINSGSQSLNSFIFDVDIVVPCNFEGKTIVLKLVFCTIDGQTVCFEFPLTLLPCSINCDPKDGDNVKGRTKNISTYNSISMYPNPANDQITFKINNTNSNHFKVVITDVLGKSHSEFTLDSEININVNQFPNGIYLVRILDSESVFVFTDKLIISR